MLEGVIILFIAFILAFYCDAESDDLVREIDFLPPLSGITEARAATCLVNIS